LQNEVREDDAQNILNINKQSVKRYVIRSQKGGTDLHNSKYIHDGLGVVLFDLRDVREVVRHFGRVSITDRLEGTIPPKGDFDIGLALIVLFVGTLDLPTPHFIHFVDFKSLHPLVALIIEESTFEVSRPIHQVNAADTALSLGVLVGAHSCHVQELPVKIQQTESHAWNIIPINQSCVQLSLFTSRISKSQIEYQIRTSSNRGNQDFKFDNSTEIPGGKEAFEIEKTHALFLF